MIRNIVIELNNLIFIKIVEFINNIDFDYIYLSIFSALIIFYRESIFNFSNNVENISNIDYIGNALTVISGTVIAIVAFLIPLFLQVFKDKIKDSTANSEFIFEQIIEKNKIKQFYIGLFTFIVYLIFQNYLKIFNWGFLTYSINIFFTILILLKTYKILKDVIFKKGSDIVLEIYSYRNTQYFLIKELEKFIIDNNIEDFNNYIKKFLKLFEKLEPKIIHEDMIATKEYKDNISKDFSLVIKKSIENLHINSSFFKIIKEIPFNYYNYFKESKEFQIDFDRYFSDIFYILNSIIWKKSIEVLDSDYIYGNNIKNKYIRDIFCSNCKDIVYQMEIMILREKYSGENLQKYDLVKLKIMFENLHLNILKNYIYCICISLNSGNKDSIDYFIDGLIYYLDNYRIDENQFNNDYESDERLQLLTLNNFDDKSELVKNIKEIEIYIFENSEKIKQRIRELELKENNRTETEEEHLNNLKQNQNIEQNIRNSFIFDCFLRNVYIDFIFDMFAIFSEKYNEAISKISTEKDPFILDVIKKLVDFSPIKKTTVYTRQKEFVSSINLFFSILRSSLNYLNNNISIYQINSYFIKDSFKENYFGRGEVWSVDKLGEGVEYKLILLIYRFDYEIYNINDILQKILPLVFDSTEKIYEYKSIIIDNFLNRIENLKYDKYENYIKNVYNNFDEEKFKDNKEKLKKIFEKLKNNIENIQEEEIKKSPLDKEKSNKIKNLIRNTFEDKCKDNIFRFFNNKNKEFGNDKKDIEIINIDVNISEKREFFIVNNIYGLDEAFTNRFYDEMDRQILSHFFRKIYKNKIEEESAENILNNYIDKGYVFFEYFNTKESYKIFEDEKFSDWVKWDKIRKNQRYDLTFKYNSIDFFDKNSDYMIFVSKGYFEEIILDLKNTLRTSLSDLPDGKINLEIKCDCYLKFKNEDIKIFKLKK